MELEPVVCGRCGASVDLPAEGVRSVRCTKCKASLHVPVGVSPGMKLRRLKRRPAEPSGEEAAEAAPKQDAEEPEAEAAAPKPSPAPAIDEAKEDDAEAEEEQQEERASAGSAPVAAVQAFEISAVDEGKRRRNLIIQLGFIALAAAVVYGFVQAAKNDQMRAVCSATCALRPQYAGRNRTAPDFTLVDADGKSVTLSQFKGKTVVMNFWASWCEPCLEEMPSLARLAVALEDRKDIVFLTVNTDEDATVMREKLLDKLTQDPNVEKKVLQRIESGALPFLILRDPELSVSKGLYGTTMYPETWIIDPKGFIRSRFDGPREWDSGSARRTIEAVSQGPGCLADFSQGKPVGTYARLCDPE